MRNGKEQNHLDGSEKEDENKIKQGAVKLTSDVGGDDLGADIVLEKAGDVLVVLIPLLEPEVELSGGNGAEASEHQWKVGGN